MPNLHQIFENEGTARDVTSNRLLLLDDPESVWLLESGRVQLFMVDTRDGEPVGARKYLAQVEAGQGLFGLRPEDRAGGLRLVASGKPGTRVLKLERERFAQLAEDATCTAEIAPLIDGWIRTLFSRFSANLAPAASKTLRPGEAIDLQAGSSVTTDRGVLWAQHLEGRSEFLGEDGLSVSGPTSPFPVPEQAWLKAVDDTTIKVLETSSVLAQVGVWAGLETYQRHILSHLAAVAQRDEQMEGERIDRRVVSTRSMVENAYANLVSILDPELAPAAVAGKTEGPLSAACRLVGESLGMGIEFHENRSNGSLGGESLAGILGSSGVRHRQVILAEDWWCRDHGPLIAFVDRDQRPVALLPSSPTSYDLHDPADGAVRRITPEVAATLSPAAHSLYRSFPRRALDALDLVRFGFRGCARDLAGVLLVGLAGGLLSLATPILTRPLYDTVIPGSQRGNLLQLALALIFAAVAIAVFQFTRSISLLRIEARTSGALQAAVVDRLLDLPPAFFRQFSSGELASRAMGIDTIRQALTGTVLVTLLGGLFSIFNFAILYYFSWKLAGVATVVVLLQVSVVAGVAVLQLRYRQPLVDVQQRIAGMVFQLISGISKLRVVGAEGRAFSVWADRFAEQRKLTFKSETCENWLATVNSAFPVLGSMAIFYVVIASLRNDLTSTGTFLAFYTAFGIFSYAVLEVSKALLSLLAVVPLYRNVQPILEAVPEADEVKAQPGPLSGRIEVSHVSFRYDPAGVMILDDTSLRANPGEFIALVGPSGAGKSTLLRLLLGFERPTSGAVYYDGKNLEDLDVRAVRQQIGVVLQNARLLTGEVYDNIVGASGASLDDAWEAARMAGLEKDLRQMPMQMHTMVSEGGSNLSGGQRQRLLIARAVIKKPKIIFFDEATSARDNETQAVVNESLARLMVTQVVIAHRLSPIRTNGWRN